MPPEAEKRIPEELDSCISSIVKSTLRATSILERAARTVDASTTSPARDNSRKPASPKSVGTPPRKPPREGKNSK
jgi:hypothetical protein